MPPHRVSRFPRAALLLGVCALAACSDHSSPLNTDPGPSPVPDPVEVARISCTANTRTRAVDCGGSGLTGARGFLAGQQGVHVQLTSSNVAYDGGTGAFTFDVTVQNLIRAPQVWATADGTTPHAEGVRVFFSQEPAVLTGTGTITVNGDGVGTFTGSGQPYFEYTGSSLGADGILSSGETSSARPWSLTVPNTVETFDFKLTISTTVRYPTGWIQLTPGVDSVVAGSTQALLDSVFTQFGDLDSLAAVGWGTSDALVATVDSVGVVTGVGAGAATITATSGARTASASIAVCPNLAVGDVYTASMPAAASLCLAGGASGAAEYTYMPVNLSSSSALSLTLTATGIQAVTGPPSPDRIPLGSTGLGRAPEGPVTDEALHTRMMENDRRDLSSLLRSGHGRIEKSRRAAGPRYVVTPGVPTVGDLWNLNVAAGCSGAVDNRVGQVRSIGQHVIVVADTSNPAGGFTTAQYDSIAAEFDSLAYAVDTANFGAPTDLDTNNRVVAFYTRAVNELSPPASSVVTLGYFTARDLFSSAPTSCPRSNESEMFYMLVPDPTGAVNSNVRTVSFVRGSTVGTMGHELQHLINASRRLYIVGTNNLEEVYLNEGLSHVAEELIFYRASVGLTPRSNIVVTQLTTGPNASRRVAAFNTYANQNFGRLRGWLQRPDTAGPVKNVDGLATRGAIWAFLRYSSDRLGGTEANTWFNLVNTPNFGTGNLNAVFGATASTNWVRDWVAAMYADDAVSGIASQYTNPSWSYRSLFTALNGSYQLVPRPLSNGVGLTLSYSRGAGTAYARFGVPTNGFAGITALSGGIPPTSPYSLIVMRTK